MLAEASALAAMFSDLVRTETRLYNAINDRLRARHDLFASQFEFLLYLRDHPRARVADLAAHFAIGIGASSKGVDRLESRGLIERVPNPEDRRSSLLILTPAGTELADEAERTFDEQLTALVDGSIGPAQREQLAAALVLLRSVLEEAKVGTPAG